MLYDTFVYPFAEFEFMRRALAGALALALGLPANLPYDVDSTAAAAPVAPLADSVNAIIATALQGRPDLAATQAEVEAAVSEIDALHERAKGLRPTV